MNWSWLAWAYTFSLTVGTGYTVIAVTSTTTCVTILI